MSGKTNRTRSLLLALSIASIGTLTGCGGGGGSSGGSIVDGGGTTSPTGTTWYFAVRAYDNAGNQGPNSNEVSGTVPTGSSATLVWNPPTTSVDGSCAYDIAGYEVFYGQSSGQLGSSETVPASARTLACETTGSDACGDVLTCEYTVLPVT